MVDYQLLIVVMVGAPVSIGTQRPSTSRGGASKRPDPVELLRPISPLAGRVGPQLTRESQFGQPGTGHADQLPPGS
jgi:hypothetical protein